MVILGMVCYVYIITLTITPFENMKDQSLVASCGRKTHKTTISLQLSQSRLRLFWSQRIREAEFNSQIIDGIGQQPLHLGEPTFSQTAPGRAETPQKKTLKDHDDHVDHVVPVRNDKYMRFPWVLINNWPILGFDIRPYYPRWYYLDKANMPKLATKTTYESIFTCHEQKHQPIKFRDTDMVVS